MSFRTGLRRSLPYAVAIVGGFLIAYLIVAFFIFPSGVIPGEAKIPNVTGLLFDEASTRLAAVGFKAQRGESRYQGASPKGTVLEQDPPAGQRDIEGTAVMLTLSAGQQMIAVPQILGMTQADAQTALESSGFDLGQVTQRPSSEPRGQVIASNPAPGIRTPVPSSVSVVLSAGPGDSATAPPARTP
jgi:beta-lactam-binding protein with PASTA domain